VCLIWESLDKDEKSFFIKLYFLFSRSSGWEDAGPVDYVEDEEEAGDDVDHDLLDVLGLGLLAGPEAVKDEGELEEDEEDEDDAHQHPHVQETNVADLFKNTYDVTRIVASFLQCSDKDSWLPFPHERT